MRREHGPLMRSPFFLSHTPFPLTLLPGLSTPCLPHTYTHTPRLQNPGLVSIWKGEYYYHNWSSDTPTPHRRSQSRSQDPSRSVANKGIRKKRRMCQGKGKGERLSVANKRRITESVLPSLSVSPSDSFSFALGKADSAS